MGKEREGEKLNPRQSKPPAEPQEMPRTESDLDRLMVAVEKHKIHGHKIGEQVKAGVMDTSEALLYASNRDEALYDVLDQIAAEREEEFVNADPQLRGD